MLESCRRKAAGILCCGVHLRHERLHTPQCTRLLYNLGDAVFDVVATGTVRLSILFCVEIHAQTHLFGELCTVSSTSSRPEREVCTEVCWCSGLYDWPQ